MCASTCKHACDTKVVSRWEKGFSRVFEASVGKPLLVVGFVGFYGKVAIFLNIRSIKTIAAEQ